MDNRRYDFSANGQNYTIWMWKGDYLNLGAGAETAIYVGGDPLWEIDTDLAMPMTLELSYTTGETIYSYNPGAENPQWWITGFAPNEQRVLAENLSVTGTIDFSANPEMYKAFREKYYSDPMWQFYENGDTKIVRYTW